MRDGGDADHGVCPAWDDGNPGTLTLLEDSHCGIDLVAVGDIVGAVPFDEQVNAQPDPDEIHYADLQDGSGQPVDIVAIRRTYVTRDILTSSQIIDNHLNNGSGVYCEFGSNTYKFRQRVLVHRPYSNQDGSNQGQQPVFQIWEYQYTHFRDDRAPSPLPIPNNRRGYYIAPGSFIDSYTRFNAGITGDTAHVHVVIKVFEDVDTENLCAPPFDAAFTYINPITLTIAADPA